MPIDWHIEVFNKIESTQDAAMLAVQEGRPEGCVIQAMQQSGGRGRRGNVWEAPMGNLYMSVVLRPDCGVGRAGELAFVAAVAVSTALDSYVGDKPLKTLKWPNDVLVNGLKISGILLESHLEGESLEGLVVGMGVNIFKAPDLAISLNDVATDPVYVNKVRDKILEEFGAAYLLWQEEGFEPIRQKWLAHAHGLGLSLIHI